MAYWNKKKDIYNDHVHLERPYCIHGGVSLFNSTALIYLVLNEISMINRDIVYLLRLNSIISRFM